MEDEYLQFVTDNTDQFAKVLEQFQNEDNYPILISCSYGKDRPIVEIPVSELRSGRYFVLVFVNGKKLTKQLIIK